MIRFDKLIRVGRRTFQTVNSAKPTVAAAKPGYPTGRAEGHRQPVERHPLTVKKNNGLRKHSRRRNAEEKSISSTRTMEMI